MINGQDTAPHLVDTLAAGRAGAGQDQLAHQVGCFQRDVLRHHPAEGKAHQIDFVEAQRADQGNRVARHFVDGHRRCSARGADAPVIDRDHAMVLARPSTIRGSKLSSTAPQ